MSIHRFSLSRHESALADGVEHAMNIAQYMNALASEGVQAWKLPTILQTEFGSRCRIPKNAFGGIVQDADTELYIKLHQQAPEGLLQFKSMNTLHRRFADAQLKGLAAVRHLVLLEPADEPAAAVSIIEPASGIQGDINSEGPRERKIQRAVLKEAKRALGRKAHLLLNDLHPWNIFGHEDGSYQIIDQPFYGRAYEALRQAHALGRLGATDTCRLRQMIRRNPPLQPPAF